MVPDGLFSLAERRARTLCLTYTTSSQSASHTDTQRSNMLGCLYSVDGRNHIHICRASSTSFDNSALIHPPTSSTFIQPSHPPTPFNHFVHPFHISASFIHFIHLHHSFVSSTCFIHPLSSTYSIHPSHSFVSSTSIHLVHPTCFIHKLQTTFIHALQPSHSRTPFIYPFHPQSLHRSPRSPTLDSESESAVIFPSRTPSDEKHESGRVYETHVVARSSKNSTSLPGDRFDKCSHPEQHNLSCSSRLSSSSPEVLTRRPGLSLGTAAS
ncbi:hypothetical protein C7M84_010829 [Penaeus vannamei]|uniref:Uncharacterized protein n=1 Tax=Penaeus vannamei TaxID=6689 RepID=A0A3R7Q7Z5_PENVA|nr:hypothetical protein C7M84_010829 [Penaeus vannamei]